MTETITPTPRFSKEEDGTVHLRYGDVAFLAQATGRTSGHISRCISEQRGSDALRAEMERLVGVPLRAVVLPARSKYCKTVAA